jgi:hypothetical protein
MIIGNCIAVKIKGSITIHEMANYLELQWYNSIMSLI